MTGEGSSRIAQIQNSRDLIRICIKVELSGLLNSCASMKTKSGRIWSIFLLRSNVVRHTDGFNVAAGSIAKRYSGHSEPESVVPHRPFLPVLQPGPFLRGHGQGLVNHCLQLSIAGHLWYSMSYSRLPEVFDHLGYLCHPPKCQKPERCGDPKRLTTLFSQHVQHPEWSQIDWNRLP